MKRRSLLLSGSHCAVVVLLVLALSLGIVGCTTPVEEGEEEEEEEVTFTLRYADYRPQVGLDGELYGWLLEEITARTDGRVQFETYWGEALLTQREMLGGVKEGSADMAMIPTGIYSTELSLWNVLLPFLVGPTDPVDQYECGWEICQQSEEMQGQLAMWNQRPIALTVYGSLMIGGVVPVTTLDDVEGLTVRSATGSDSLHISALGANTVYIPAPDVYSAMEKGSIDLIYGAPGMYDIFQIYTIMPNYVILIPNFSGGLTPTTINLDTWNSLPADIQEIILEVGQEFSMRYAQEYSAAVTEMIEKWESAGAVVQELSMEDLESWADLIEEEAKAQWVAGVEAAGLPGEAVMELALQIVDKYR
jgi:TRAP-type C4-dicarboxylate transport system substrate-binding protein